MTFYEKLALFLLNDFFMVMSCNSSFNKSIRLAEMIFSYVAVPFPAVKKSLVQDL